MGRDEVRIAIIGAGGIGARHRRVLGAIPEARVTAIVDSDQPTAEAAAQEEGAAACHSLLDCLDSVDAVCINTPPSFHREYALAAAQAGKHVFCEKPLAISLEDGHAIAAAVAASGVKFMMGFNQRFRAGFQRLKDIVASGQLGKPLNAWSHRIGRGIPRGYNWRTDPDLLCGMSIESLSHDIDLLRWMLGDVESVSARVLASLPDLPGFDDNAAVVLGMANGSIATIHASWSSHVGFNSRGVAGTQGSACVGGDGLWSLERFRFRAANTDEEQLEAMDDRLDDRSYLEEDRHFVDCILRDAEPSATVGDGLAALRVSHALLESQRSGTVVRL